MQKNKFLEKLVNSTKNLHFFPKTKYLLSKSSNFSASKKNSHNKNSNLMNISLSIIKKPKTPAINNIKLQRPTSLKKPNIILKSANFRNKYYLSEKLHFFTENENNITSTKISTETSATSKRCSPTVNLSMLSINKLKKAKKINSLRNTSLRLHKKNKDLFSVISEESAFTSKNNSYNKNKNKTNIDKVIEANDSIDKFDISLTYSDDTCSKRKTLCEEKQMNQNTRKENINSFQINKKNEDFQTFCQEIRKKLFGNDKI